MAQVGEDLCTWSDDKMSLAFSNFLIILTSWNSKMQSVLAITNYSPPVSLIPLLFLSSVPIQYPKSLPALLSASAAAALVVFENS